MLTRYIGTFPDLKEKLAFVDNAFDKAVALKTGTIQPQPGMDPEYDDAAVAGIESDLDEYLETQGAEMQEHRVLKKDDRFQKSPSPPSQPAEYELKSKKKGFKRFHTPFLRHFLQRLPAAEVRREVALKDSARRMFANFDKWYTEWKRAVQHLAVWDCLMSLRIDDASGPNMGGKSALLRQMCTLVFMECFVPADKCRLTPVDDPPQRRKAPDSQVPSDEDERELVLITDLPDYHVIAGGGSVSIVASELDEIPVAIKAVDTCKRPELLDELYHECDAYTALEAVQGDCIPILVRPAPVVLWEGMLDGLVLSLITGRTLEEMGMDGIATIPLECREQAVRDLRKIHSLGVLHGSLAMRNLIWCQDDRPRIVFVDFGRAIMCSDAKDGWFKLEEDALRDMLQIRDDGS
ncbi:hypothetical protein DYB32_010318, partial [Aphanomyces invadans]